MAYFPMFIELKNMPCLVIGGGAVAVRKVQVLKEFEAEVTVLSEQFVPALEERTDIVKIKKSFERSDLSGFFLVVAATDDVILNRSISEECKKRNIFVNVVDQQEDCGFIFPSYLKRGEVVAAFSSGGKSPALAKRLKQIMEENIPEETEDAAEFLGRLRERVKREIDNPLGRKQFYEKLLDMILSEHRLPEEHVVAAWIEEWRKS
ncbi:MAG: bifunctional precorrin-2 dehydrogenase/sirohydrochlorin ferrochelatase [Lachnospiraceae bacterium]|nr:bifunctional precorrin-2 dehydrogenase/sirohydrochlorin ferrochelatase [Lachnospiraceae bacterium]